MNQRRFRRLPTWAVVLISMILTAAILAGGLFLALGRSGVALVEGWLLAKYAFVDTSADLDGAADQALYGLVSGLGDRWSYYLSHEDYLRVMESRANSYVGVGVTVSYEREEGLLVISVVKDAPADKAGVMVGDVITAVDGLPATGESQQTAVDNIKGEVGTRVTLTLLGADGSVREVVCTRAKLNNPSASGQMLEEDIGYVQLANFYNGAANSFRTEVEQLVLDGARGLVIDLRNDPGGYLAELKEILDYLLPAGPVFTEKSRWWKAEVYESDENYVDLPMVVLVNGETYSAAELLAAQLRESIQAPIVGELTSGKGYSQITFALPNGGGIGLSTATYCTGSGHSLIGEGITPDVELAYDGSDGDNQLQAALELLK